MRNILNHHPIDEESANVPRPHEKSKRQLDPLLREALEALSINLQTFMKYTDYHENRGGRSTIFGISSPTISFSCSNNNSVSMSCSAFERQSINNVANLLQFDPECVEDEEILLSELEYKQLKKFILIHCYIWLTL